MAYCDLNYLTPFVNKYQLSRFGGKAVSKFGSDIQGERNIHAERKANDLKSCVVNRNVLGDDISKNKPAMGAVLTMVNLKQIEIKEVHGTFNAGKKVYEKLCKRHDMDKEFRKEFCHGNQLNNNLDKSPRNDIRHVGSAILLGEKEIFTNNLKHIKPIEKVTDIKVN
jgi:hypothetical protein